LTRSAAHPVAGSFRVVLVTAATFLSLALMVTGMRSYRDLAAQRAREASLQMKIGETEERIRRLERTVDLLATDPGTLERVAREDLGMVMPGDIVLRLSDSEPDEEVSDQSSASPPPGS
jgi:cell division protein FtsB